MPDTDIRAGTYTDEQARDLGHWHGYAAADYAASMSGEDLDTLEPARTRPLGMTAREVMFYDDGYDRGIDAFKLADEMSDWPDMWSDEDLAAYVA